MQSAGKGEGIQPFLVEKQRFIEAILLRKAELSELGRTFNKAEYDALGRLLQQIYFLDSPPKGPKEVIPSRSMLMGHQETSVSGQAPSRSFSLHRVHYLRDPVYFELDGDPSEHRLEALASFHRLAARVTAQAVARWADRYVAYPLAVKNIPPAERRREGFLPTDLQKREALIEDLFDWFDRFSVELYLAGLHLYEGKQPIMSQSRGIPGELDLTMEEFTELQQIWERKGLPRDLYYPAHERRTIIEQFKTLGGVVRAYRHYSPRQWEQRLQAGVKPLPIPSEEERLEAFIAACDRFAQAVALRMAELTEPGQTVKPAKLQQLKTIYHEVSLAALRAREALLPTPEAPEE